MPKAWVTVIAVLGLVGMPATAQSVHGSGGVSADAEPQPDWYRQFTLNAPTTRIEVPDSALQSEPDTDLRLEWRQTGRWQFSVDLRSRPGQSPLPREEMSAGATFSITPRISIGGDVSLGAEELNGPAALSGEELETGIRLRSAFKF